MTSPRLPSSERRVGIIKAATRLFSDKGFRGATTRELASIVGVSEPVLYQHFGNKKDLYKAILEESAYLKELSEASLCPPDGVGQDREYLTQLANRMIDWHSHDPSYIRLLLFSALEDHEMFQVSEKFYEGYKAALVDNLTRFFATRSEQGIFRPIDPAVATNTFVSLVMHYSLHLTIFKKGCPDLPQSDAVAGFIDIFLEGIKQRAN